MLKKSSPLEDSSATSPGENHTEKLSHAQRGNLNYIEGLYESFLKNPHAVDPEWKLFFEGVEFAKGLPSTVATSSGDSQVSIQSQLINAYRDYGHLDADLNPLIKPGATSKELELSRFGLKEKDLSQPLAPFLLSKSSAKTLGEALDYLKRVYCGTLSIQVNECEPMIRDWFVREMESEQRQLTPDEKKEILNQLTRTEALEKFLHSRFVGAKRFSIEGTDALIPMLESLTVKGCQNGMEELLVGMAHRGRLNVLATFMGKPLSDLFAQFEGIAVNKHPEIDGDVKYHLGYTAQKETSAGKCQVSLAFNPSHLEAVDPVVAGITRAKQRMLKDTLERKKAIPFVVHGDAAFAGQGVVFETLQMSQLRGYRVGGTIHVVANNQVGFTTEPKDARTSRYPTDTAKAILAPVIHVNGDDVEACVRSVDMALRFRQAFGRDVVIQLVGYRRFGHNEGDEPTFTQPLLYQFIQKHPTLREIYAQKLVSEGVMSEAETSALLKAEMDRLQEILVTTRKSPPEMKFFSFTGPWQGLRAARTEDMKVPVKTKVALETIKSVGQKLTSYPKDFNIHPKVKSLVDKRAKMISGDEPLDWGMAELLAYGTLLFEGTPVRLSGQDCIRGTFSHRHSMFFDVKTGDAYNPLNAINSAKEFCVYNSFLSEFAVLGFEYGNAITDPSFLTIWEAQFGDFANGAQVIIDQYLSAGEAKWQQMCGLVMLLPHGYEGQGPEHSSARLERFLQLCAQDNIQVANFTTPAQLFHALRRQMKRDFRKPLVVMSPKSLLRHPKVVSSLKDLSEGTFHEILDDDKITDRKKVESVVLCTGKLYYDLDEERDKRGSKSEKVSLVRVEQLYPFADDQLISIFKNYPALKRVTWAQEEPQNMGAHSFMMPRLQSILKELSSRAIELRYVGRNMRSSPATGYPQLHKAEQTAIVNACFE